MWCNINNSNSCLSMSLILANLAHFYNRILVINREKMKQMLLVWLTTASTNVMQHQPTKKFHPCTRFHHVKHSKQLAVFITWTVAEICIEVQTKKYTHTRPIHSTAHHTRTFIMHICIYAFGHIFMKKTKDNSDETHSHTLILVSIAKVLSHWCECIWPQRRRAVFFFLFVQLFTSPLLVYSLFAFM